MLSGIAALCHNGNVLGVIMTWCRSRIGLLLLLCLAMSAAPLPQQPTSEDVNIPAVRVTTRMVLVDAVVTDKSGQRVKGLTKDDFTILENGKPQQQIAVFSSESRGFGGAPPSRPALPE